MPSDGDYYPNSACSTSYVENVSVTITSLVFTAMLSTCTLSLQTQHLESYPCVSEEIAKEKPM